MYVGSDGDDLSIESQAVREAARLILQSDDDARGTVASLSREIDEFTADGKFRHMYTSILT